MALFIGGPMDGQHVEVESSRNYIQVAIEKPLKIKEEHTVERFSTTVERDLFTYKAETLACPNKQYTVFIPDTYDCQDFIDHLIKGYRPSDN